MGTFCPPQSLDGNLLVDGVCIEQKDQSDQPPHRLIQAELEEWVVNFWQLRKAKREDSKREQEHHDDCHAPQPPVALFQFTKLFLDTGKSLFCRRIQRLRECG